MEKVFFLHMMHRTFERSPVAENFAQSHSILLRFQDISHCLKNKFLNHVILGSINVVFHI